MFGRAPAIIQPIDKWIALNPAKAALGITRLLVGSCFACGREDRPVENLPKSLAIAYFVCDDCKLKHDPKELLEESERLMVLLNRPDWKRRMTPMLCPEHDDEHLVCRFCKKNRLVQDPYTHEVPIICEECWRTTLAKRSAGWSGQAKESA